MPPRVMPSRVVVDHKAKHRTVCSLIFAELAGRWGMWCCAGGREVGNVVMCRVLPGAACCLPASTLEGIRLPSFWMLLSSVNCVWMRPGMSSCLTVTTCRCRWQRASIKPSPMSTPTTKLNVPSK